MSQLLVDGQRVVPTRALTAGFTFKFPNLGGALEHLLGHPATANGTNKTQADIYYNGECPICNAEMTHYAELCATSHPELRFIDSTQQPNEFASCGLRREHLERRVYIKGWRGPDSERHAGHHCALVADATIRLVSDDAQPTRVATGDSGSLRPRDSADPDALGKNSCTQSRVIERRAAAVIR
jgi:hypothetical protein